MSTHPGLTIGLVVLTSVSTLPSRSVVVLNSSTPVERFELPVDETAEEAEAAAVVDTGT